MNTLAAVVDYGLRSHYSSWKRPKQWGDVLVTPYAAVRVVEANRFKTDPMERKGVLRLQKWARVARRRRIAVKFSAAAEVHPTYPERKWHQSNIMRRTWKRPTRLGLAPQHYDWLLNHDHTAIRLASNDTNHGWVFVVFDGKEPIAWFAPLVAYLD